MMATGFLVVLLPEWLGVEGCDANPNYRGVDRLPPYSPSSSKFPSEAEALDAYVFGEFKDSETDMIPTLDRARQLLSLFGDSPRRFEIIEVTEAMPFDVPPSTYDVIGYDVAGRGGDFYSVTHDFPLEWSKGRYMQSLNQYGLFPDHRIATEFRGDGLQAALQGWDTPITIYRIALIQ